MAAAACSRAGRLVRVATAASSRLHRALHEPVSFGVGCSEATRLEAARRGRDDLGFADPVGRGVRAAGAGSSLPPDIEQVEITLRLTGDAGEESHRFSAAVVTPGYLEAIGARLLEGRHFEEADLTPMARSFYGGSRRISNALIKSELGVRLAHPNYREGLKALAGTA